MEDKLLNQVARFKISSREFEIMGPVEFVDKQIEKHAELINAFLAQIKEKQNLTRTPMEKEIQANRLSLPNSSEYADFVELPSANKSFQKYSSIISIDNDKIHVLVAVPGESLTRRMINLAMIYLWVKKQQNIESSTFNEIRDFCERHAELDKAHFAYYINSHKRIFLVEGAGRGQIAKLSVPGLREAENLIDQMNKEH